MDIRAEVVGVPGWRAVLRIRLAQLDQATRRATEQGALLVERDTKRTLMLQSHPKGTPTPSAPGEPPAMVTGFLARSMEHRGPKPTGPFRWHAEAGPTAVYSRIQELGGYVHQGARSYNVTGPIGRSEYTHLPARPYLAPTQAAATPKIRNGYIREWARVIGR